MKKVFLGTKRVQKLGRIILDEAALRNADLAIGDEVELSFDADSSAIIIEKARTKMSQPATPPRKTATKGTKQ